MASEIRLTASLIDHVAKALLDHDRMHVSPFRSWNDIHRRQEYRDRAAVALAAMASARPSDDELKTAADCLEMHAIDGEDLGGDIPSDAEVCFRVVEWLRSLITEGR